MDDRFDIQQPQKSAPTSPTNPANQPDPSKAQDKDKFSKLVERDKDSEEKAGAAASSLDDDAASIFALSRTALTKKKKEASQEGKELLSGQTRADISGILSADDELSLGDTDEDGKNQNSLDLSQETRKDIFQFISNATQVQGTQFSDMVSGAFLSAKDAAEVASQIEKMMILMQKNGDTTTTVTLNRPGLFDGAIVNVHQFGTAPGEFNLSFENLNNQAKMMLDLKTSRDNLLQTLQEKGYNVHIVITTTEIERPEYQQELNPQQDQGRQQQGDQQQEQPKK